MSTVSGDKGVCVSVCVFLCVISALFLSSGSDRNASRDLFTACLSFIVIAVGFLLLSALCSHGH